MLFLILYVFGLVLAVGAGVMAAWGDFRRLKIPNIYSLVVAVAFILAWGADWLGHGRMFMPLSSHLISGGVVFVLTLILFAAKLLGGGDAKLMSAYALWLGARNVSPFLFFVALAGAFLGVAALIIRRFKPFKNPKEGGWIAGLQQGGKSGIPYGLAIVSGSIVAFLLAGYLTPGHLSSFLPAGN